MDQYGNGKLTLHLSEVITARRAMEAYVADLREVRRQEHPSYIKVDYSYLDAEISRAQQIATRLYWGAFHGVKGEQGA